MTLMEKQRTAELRGIEIGENRGREQGIVIGESRGREQGIVIGENRGIGIGEKKKSFEIARKMITRKLPLEQIVYCSGLTISDIQALVEEMDQKK